MYRQGRYGLSEVVCNLILFGTSITVCGLFFWWPQAGALAYLVAVLVTPGGQIGTWTPRVDQILIIPLVLIGLFRLRRRPVFMSGWLLSLLVWVAWITIGALFSELPTDWLGLGGTVRAIGVAWLFSQMRWSPEEFRRAHIIFVLLGIPISLLTVGQVVGLPWVRFLTQAAYTSWTSPTFAGQIILEAAGTGFRGVGLFGTPAGAGTYFALGLVFGIFLLSQKVLVCGSAKLGIILAMLFCVVGGIASQSGTFLAATVTMLLGSLIALRQVDRRRLIRLVACWLVLFVVAVGFGLYKAQRLSGNLSYQIDGFVSGTRLSNRYSQDQSSVVAAWQDVLDHPVAGVGAVKASYSLCDSLYISILSPSGFAGSALFFLPILVIAWKAWRFGGSGDYVTLWTLAMLSTGVATNGMFVPRIGDWWWAVQGMFLSITMSTSPQTSISVQHLLRTLHRDNLRADLGLDERSQN
jgi:hypothetical protein